MWFDAIKKKTELHLSAAQDVIDVFKEGFLHDLCVDEQEDGGLILDARLPVQTTQVCKQWASGKLIT